MSTFKLSAQKRALLEMLRREQGLQTATQSIPRRPASDTAPLSFAQQRLWFLDQFEPGKPFYNLPAAVRLQGHLNIPVLEQSFNAIVQRHEALRTTFQPVEGQPVQTIAPADSAVAIPLALIDLRELPESARETEVQQFALKEAQQSFDLAQRPLLRTTLLQLDEAEFVLLLTLHHIAADGWSIGVLIRELADFYQAFSTGQQPNLPELAIQYADFAVWQQQQQELLDSQLAYWKQQLQDAPPLLELPTDRSRPPEQTYRGATQLILLPKELTEALKDLSQRENVTLFMTLLAAFKTLLYRYTNQADLVVGTTIANRNRAEVEGLIGIFINTLVLRTDLAGNPSFRTLLERVRQVTLGAYTHQDLPFEKLVEELQPNRSLSYNPLFQVMFQLRNEPMPALELPGVNLSLLSIETHTTQFDLSLDITEVAEGLRVIAEYSTDLFDATTITRLLGHFQTLLDAIVANPDQCLTHLSLLSASERQHLLEWGNVATQPLQSVSELCCLPHLFEVQVERTPEAIAVVFENQQLTYQELNQRANQLAHYLQTLGVGPEIFVGLCVDRSIEMLIGILGILKAGGAYVPLDPAYPSSRLAFMLNDAQVGIVLTQQQLVKELPERSAPIICLDTERNVIAQFSSDNCISHTNANDLACVIYTSGSTGQPKGVMVSHQAIINHNLSIAQAFELQPNDRVLQFASISFDVAIEELFPAWLSGATVVIPPSDRLLAPGNEFVEFITQAQLTVLNLPASYWHAWVRELSLSSDPLPDCLRLVLVGSEKISLDCFQDWMQLRGKIRWLNAYGTTETTITSTLYEPDTTSVNLSLRTLPIGRPIANTEIYVLDPQLQPVPIGLPGELYIGGLSLAKGYLNQPELTAEKFIPNPFQTQGGSDHLYKTGDLARWLPDGNLELLGRIDQQIKIRGFRIELGEIETLLDQHPAIENSVVIVRKDVSGTKRLVAYVVLNGLAASLEADLKAQFRSYLQQQLPEYMVPAAFVFLDALPLLPNGKLDRRSLPLPEPTPSIPPVTTSLTPIEQQLAQIWAEVLGLEEVGIHDNFFELGGDSILSIQIIAKANQAGLQITPKQLFQHQTIAELAAIAQQTQSTQAEQGIITGEIPLTPIQHWFFEQDFAEPHHWNQAVLLKIVEKFDLALVERVLQYLLMHHDVLRLRFTSDSVEWQQFAVEPDGIVPFTRIDLSTLPLDQQLPALEVAATKLQANLNLTKGPLLRVALFELGENQPDRLLIVVHHLVIDNVSWRILLEDFHTAYRQLQRGETIQLPAKTTSFKAWSERLNQYAPSAAAQLDDWLNSLQRPVVQLPVDYPNGKNTVATARTFEAVFSTAETHALLTEIPKIYRCQINEVLLTALVQAVADWTNAQTLLADLEGHGREDLFADVDLSRTVGWFTTQFPICLQLEESVAPSEALNAVKEQLRSLPDRGISYGILRYLSHDHQITEQLSALPAAEISFNYLGQFDPVLPEENLFCLAHESIGSAFGPNSHRSHLLEINSFVSGGQLRLNWTYSEALHQPSTIERLAQQFVENVRSLITQNPSEVTTYTPADFSDFQWSQWDQSDLNDILTAIGEA